MKITNYLIHVAGLLIGCLLYSEVPNISLFNIIFNSIMIMYYLALEVKKYKQWQVNNAQNAI